MSKETLGDLIRANIIYTRFGKKYRKLKRNEIIEEGAMQSWCCGELQPITNSDGETIGDTPSSFSDERDFYNPIYGLCPVCDESIDKKENLQHVVMVWTCRKKH